MKLKAARADNEPDGAQPMLTVPVEESSKPDAMRMRVVLPEPLWPISATRSPVLISNEMGSSAGEVPYDFDTLSMLSAECSFG